MTEQTVSLPGLWAAFRTKVIARKFVRDVSVLAIANGVAAVLSFTQTILVARWLGPELYGIAALAMSVPSLVYTFFDARSAEASVKYLSEFHARGEREQALAVCRLGFAVDFSVAAVAFIGIAALAPWAARIVVHRSELAGLIVLYGAAFLPHALRGTSYAVLASLGRFPMIALLDTVGTFIRVSLVFGLVVAGWGVAGVIWGNAIATALGSMLYSFPAILLLRRTWGTLPWVQTWQVLRGHRREIVRFLAYNDLNGLIGMIPKQLDVVFLGYFRNPVEVGYYKLAKSLAGALDYFVQPLQAVTYPKLAVLWAREDWLAWRKIIRQLSHYIGPSLGGAGCFCLVILPIILPVLAGDTFTPSIPAAQLLMVGAVTWLTFFWLRPTYRATGRIRELFKIDSYVIAVTAILYPVASYYWGYLGLALLRPLRSFIFHGLSIWLLFRLGTRL